MAEKKKDTGSWWYAVIGLTVIAVCGFILFTAFDSSETSLTNRLNVRFGNDTTPGWELAIHSVGDVAVNYLIDPVGTRKHMNESEDYVKWKRLIDIAEFWEQKLKTPQGKNALKAAESDVQENYETCVILVGKIESMMKE